MRDSVLTRLENMHYEAYVHCCAILWKTVFQELRGLTNTTSILNPMELNDLYDHLWNVGVVLERMIIDRGHVSGMTKRQVKTSTMY